MHRPPARIQLCARRRAHRPDRAHHPAVHRPRRAGAAQGARARPVTEAAAPRPTPCGCARLSRLVARARTVAWTFACPRRTSPMSVCLSRSLARRLFLGSRSEAVRAPYARRAVRMLSGRTGYVSRKTIASCAHATPTAPLPLALRPAKAPGAEITHTQAPQDTPRTGTQDTHSLRPLAARSDSTHLIVRGRSSTRSSARSSSIGRPISRS
mmetsp:Transcript_23006/g.68718  ORF Transcript_23006/g.68718 Transcript_23006/m.68718 type:complete len:211 (-) Transcript_23006:228-860(-)